MERKLSGGYYAFYPPRATAQFVWPRWPQDDPEMISITENSIQMAQFSTQEVQAGFQDGSINVCKLLLGRRCAVPGCFECVPELF